MADHAARAASSEVLRTFGLILPRAQVSRSVRSYRGMRPPFRKAGPPPTVAYLASVLGALACAAGECHETVATLSGAAEAVRGEVGSAGYAFYEPDVALARHAVEHARSVLGEAAFEVAYDLGRGFTMPEAVAFARSQLTATGMMT